MTEFFTHANTYAIATIVFMIGSWISFVVIYDCKFAQFEDISTSGALGSFGVYFVAGSDGRCHVPGGDETTDDFLMGGFSDFWWGDHYMIIARVTGTVANVVANLCWITMWIGLCANWSTYKSFRIACGVLAFICAVLSGFVFWAFDSEICHQDDVECSHDRGSILNICIIAIYVITGLICMFIPEPHKFSDGVVQVTIEKTERKDGSILIKTTTLKRDGTTCVEERHVDHLDETSDSDHDRHHV